MDCLLHTTGVVVCTSELPLNLALIDCYDCVCSHSAELWTKKEIVQGSFKHENSDQIPCVVKEVPGKCYNLPEEGLGVHTPSYNSV
jgi:hypothetical protein